MQSLNLFRIMDPWTHGLLEAFVGPNVGLVPYFGELLCANHGLRTAGCFLLLVLGRNYTTIMGKHACSVMAAMLMHFCGVHSWGGGKPSDLHDRTVSSLEVSRAWTESRSSKRCGRELRSWRWCEGISFSLWSAQILTPGSIKYP